MRKQFLPVCSGQVDPEAADFGRQQEDEDVAASVELVDQGLAGADRGRAILNWFKEI